MLGCALLAALVAGCGGGSGGGGSSSNDDDTSSGSTISGVAQKTSGSTLSRGGWQEWPAQLLASLISSGHAAIGGLADVPDGTPVRLIRIGSDGNQVEQLASTTTTNSEFEFTGLELGDDLSGNLVVEVGDTDPLRAPGGGEDLVVNPVSLSIANKMLERMQADDQLSFSDYRASDLANLVQMVVEELDAAGATLSGTNADAAAQADTDAGTVDDDLVTSVEGENTLADSFVGAKNIGLLGLELEASARSLSEKPRWMGSYAGRWSAVRR